MTTKKTAKPEVTEEAPAASADTQRDLALASAVAAGIHCSSCGSDRIVLNQLDAAPTYTPPEK